MPFPDTLIWDQVQSDLQSTGQVNMSYPLCILHLYWSIWSTCPHTDLAWLSQHWFLQMMKIPPIHLGFVHTWKNFIPPDFHIIIPVSPWLLMVKSQSMQNLMFNDGFIVTPQADGKVLSDVLVTNLRPAPIKRRQENFLRWLQFKGFQNTN